MTEVNERGGARRKIGDGKARLAGSVTTLGLAGAFVGRLNRVDFGALVSGAVFLAAPLAAAGFFVLVANEASLEPGGLGQGARS